MTSKIGLPGSNLTGQPGGSGGSSIDTGIIRSPGGYASSLTTSARTIYNYNLTTVSHQLGGTTMVRAGTIKNLYINAIGNLRDTDVICEIYKNGSSTGISATVTALGTDNYSDTVNTVTVVAGDYISFTLRDSAGGAAGNFVCSMPTCEIEYS